MLSKIFSFSNRKADKKAFIQDVDTSKLCSEAGFYPDLEASHIRVLIYKDCDRKGKRVIYDTKSYPKNEEKSQVSSNKISSGKGGHCKQSKNEYNGKKNPTLRRSSSDSALLGEMIFGSVAMTYKGSTVKVHTIRSPHQLLLSKVFTLKPVISVLSSLSDSSDSLPSSQHDSLLDSRRSEQDLLSLSSQNGSPKDFQDEDASTPVAVPGITIEPEEDSGFTTSLDSLYSRSGSVTSLCSLASSPCGNFQRRLHRTQIKSIDKHSAVKTENGVDEPNSPILRRQPKIGIGVLLPLEGDEEKNRALQGFFFAHFPLFDSHIHRLRCAIEKVFRSRNSFLEQVTEAITRFSEDICSLLKTPRLKEPVWLQMMSFPDDRRTLCEQLMQQFASIMKLCNNKENGFFLSCLLSAVLTHHLSWVPTVMPAGAAPNRAYLDKHSSQTLDLLAQSHPYNPLWAQLSDLYGAIGSPLKLAKTVVTGKDSKVVGQLLNLVSYFIRCANVFEHSLQRDESNIDSRKSQNECCCLCSEDKYSTSKLDLDHKHNICESCMEKTGLSICINCKKLLPKELTDSTLCGESNQTQQNLLEGLPCCDKCGLLQRYSNMNGFNQRSILSGSSLPKWASAQELQHFFVYLTFTERSETFRCYCCEDLEPMQDGRYSDTKSSFQCYCVDDTCHHCYSKMNECNHNAKTYGKSGGNSHLGKTFMELLVHGEICEKLECSCDCNRDNSMDGCGNVYSNGLDSELPDWEFVQTSCSCIDKTGGETECLSVDTLEDDHDFGPEELPLIGINNVQCNKDDDKWRKCNNFGHTLFSGVSETYHPDFVLQGVTCSKENLLPSLSSDLCLALQHSVIDDVLSDAVCIVADTDNWTCELLSAKKEEGRLPRDSIQPQPIEVSNLVLSMLSSVIGLWEAQMPAEFCLMHLEDRLKEIYLKSTVVGECLRYSKRAITKDQLARTIGIDDSDVMLLLAVASSHSPQDMFNLR